VLHYCAADVINRSTGLARRSIRLSVSYRFLTRKIKNTENFCCVDIPQGASGIVCSIKVRPYRSLADDRTETTSALDRQNNSSVSSAALRTEQLRYNYADVV